MSARSSSSDSDDRVSASVLELTQQCISLFEGCANSGQNEDRSALETRLADLRLWADGVGAIAQGTASLEWRFRSRPEDLLLVKTILILLADFVEDYSTFLEALQPTDDALKHIDSTIENLALISVAIRRTGKASRRRRADARFDLQDHEEFRRHLECIILLRPSKSGLQSELNPSSLSIVQKRLIEANLKRRHRFVIAQKHFHKVEGASRSKRKGNTSVVDVPLKERDKKARPQPGEASKTTSQQEYHQRAPPTNDGLTAASTAEGTLQYGDMRRYVPGAARTQITTLAADAEFPKPPPNPQRCRIGKCPCCCQSILAEEMMNPDRWRQHIVEDLLPYTCIIEDCPTPEIAMFSTRKEWEAHVEMDHPAQWHCALCGETDVMIESEEVIIHHLETEHQDDVKELTMETVLLWSEIRSMGIHSCPLCYSFGREDSPEIVDHVLRHVYEFSLRALPWTKPFTHNLNKRIGTFVLPNDQDLAERLVEWVDQAEGNTGQVLQLSEVEAAYRERDVAETIDDTGYVPEDEYFDGESEAKSLKPELAPTERSDGSDSISLSAGDSPNQSFSGLTTVNRMPRHTFHEFESFPRDLYPPDAPDRSTSSSRESQRSTIMPISPFKEEKHPELLGIGNNPSLRMTQDRSGPTVENRLGTFQDVLTESDGLHAVSDTHEGELMGWPSYPKGRHESIFPWRSSGDFILHNIPPQSTRSPSMWNNSSDSSPHEEMRSTAEEQ